MGGMPMPSTELAEELLQLEEADAWFEYLESTRGQSETRYSELEPWAWARLSQRLRAVRARRARLRPAAACPLLCSRAHAGSAGSLCAGHVDHRLSSTQREARPADGRPGPARDRTRRTNPWHYAGFALARSKRIRQRRNPLSRRLEHRLRRFR